MSRPTSSGDFSERRVLRDPADIGPLKDVVLRELEARDYGHSAGWAIHLALEEALTNAFHHGNKNDPGKAVHFACTIGQSTAAFEIQDQGPGFDPDSVPDPTHDENIEIPSGRGIMLMRAYMDDVEFLPPGNKLRMVYRKEEG
jgi:serine/threonine-protein kinase RsbW